ncbi:PREDICTED: zinc finger BED domain-containing protein RICESLEEPER 1-like [Ipomoea nil]|uniref:zinc finger BED domain-containing protein RICESLEEPER 1-like n=2 Tax=Ipomoea nil TaxID=35883 RepID=UPI00090112E3|nr:PREDICTED: zinc finger BED domain-containing protein RICESLEEPER 1-like [Ipomoea nil]
MTSNNTNESIPEEVNVQVTTTTPSISSSQPIESNNSEEVNRVDNDSILTKKRKKTSPVWNDFEEIELANGTKKAVCLYCKEKYSTGGKGASTSHLKRHSEICLQRKLHISRENKQTTIQFRPPSECGGNPFIVPNAKYSNEKMREIIASGIMVHERPFSIVEDDMFMWAFEYANPNFRRVSRKTTRSDCLQLYEAEKNTLKRILNNVSKVSITTDMWKSSHQVVEYMVVTGHFVDASWNLQKRVLNFVKVPPPRRGTDIANAIFKCLRGWGIENKIFSVTVDNASYNDSCVRSLKENMSLSSKLVLDGQLFHVRCCAHILNLLVQDGLNTIKDVIHNVRESVKFINSSDARLKSFHEVVELKGLKERKLILDCPTRWNSTFLMLCTASKFKHAFSDYNEKEPHYKYAPSFEDWDKIEKGEKGY